MFEGRQGQVKGVDWVKFGEAHYKNVIREKKEIHAWVSKSIEIRGYKKPCDVKPARPKTEMIVGRKEREKLSLTFEFFPAILLFGIHLALLFSAIFDYCFPEF